MEIGNGEEELRRKLVINGMSYIFGLLLKLVTVLLGVTVGCAGTLFMFSRISVTVASHTLMA